MILSCLIRGVFFLMGNTIIYIAMALLKHVCKGQTFESGANKAL